MRSQEIFYSVIALNTPTNSEFIQVQTKQSETFGPKGIDTFVWLSNIVHPFLCAKISARNVCLYLNNSVAMTVAKRVRQRF